MPARTPALPSSSSVTKIVSRCLSLVLLCVLCVLCGAIFLLFAAGEDAGAPERIFSPSFCSALRCALPLCGELGRGTPFPSRSAPRSIGPYANARLLFRSWTLLDRRDRALRRGRRARTALVARAAFLAESVRRARHGSRRKPDRSLRHRAARGAWPFARGARGSTHADSPRELRSHRPSAGARGSRGVRLRSSRR